MDFRHLLISRKVLIRSLGWVGVRSMDFAFLVTFEKVITPQPFAPYIASTSLITTETVLLLLER